MSNELLKQIDILKLLDEGALLQRNEVIGLRHHECVGPERSVDISRWNRYEYGPSEAYEVGDIETLFNSLRMIDAEARLDA